jgi:hypothetical protein
MQWAKRGIRKMRQQVAAMVAWFADGTADKWERLAKTGMIPH